MNDIIQYLTDNRADITSIVIGIIVVARLIVKLTPTPKDDTWLAKVVDILGHIGLKLPLLLCVCALSACSTVTTRTETHNDGKTVQTVVTRTVDGPTISSIGQLLLGGLLSFKEQQ